MSARTFVLLALAALCFLAALAGGLGRLREQRAADLQEELLAGWFASRTESHLLRFAVQLERYASGLEPDRDGFLEQVEVLGLAVQRLVRERDGARLAASPTLGPLAREVEARLAALEPVLAGLEPGDRSGYRLVRERLGELERPLAEIVSRAYGQFLAAAASSNRLAEAFREGLLTSLGLTAASAALLVALAVGAVREAGRARSRADRATSAARDVEESLRTLVDALPVAVTTLDEQGRVLLLNRHASELTGVSEAGALGRPPDRAGLPGTLVEAWRGEAGRFRETSLVLPGGERKELLASSCAVRRADGSLARTVCIALDVTERRRAEEQLRHLAEHDPLTGLGNRGLLTRDLERALAEARRPLALHLLDLDGFKEINDSLGHPVGDQLLTAVAARLRRAVPPSARIARLGGDEFAVLQPDLDAASEARALAEGIVAALAEPFAVPAGRLRVGTSIGIALGPEHGRDAAELLRNADIALYRAKARARGSIELFSIELARAQARRHRLSAELERVVRRGLLDLHFQPVVRLRDRRVTACEALLRWPAERGEEAPPIGEIVTLAEEIGLAGPLTEWVLQTACRRARLWLEQGWPCPIAVNISMTPAVLDRLVPMVEAALAGAGLAPDLLELEVTEGVLIRNFEAATQTLARLRAQGIRIALDDFGTGYSALAYLQRFPLDKLKVDRRFTSELGRTATALPIVDAIVRLGHALGLAIVAEGVEEPIQLELLRSVGCDEAQGFLLGRPERAEQVLHRHRPRPPTAVPEPGRRHPAPPAAVPA